MAKREVKTDKIRTPSGVFSQATVIEAQGRLVFISGMTARRPDGTIAGVGDITAQTQTGLRERQVGGGGGGRHA